MAWKLPDMLFQGILILALKQTQRAIIGHLVQTEMMFHEVVFYSGFNINFLLPRLEASKALVCPTTMFGLVIICAKIGAWHCLLVVNLLKRDKGAHL